MRLNIDKLPKAVRLQLAAQYGMTPKDTKKVEAKRAKAEAATAAPLFKNAVQVKPLSVNEAWQGRRFKTRKYKDFEQRMALLLPPVVDIPEGKLAVKIELGFSNAASDIDNPVKMILDILQKRYGFNDARIYALHVTKTIVPASREFIAFEINQHDR